MAWINQLKIPKYIKSLKKINQQVNQDKIKNKISLNTSKTEIIIFRPKQKQITKHLNFRISAQKINTCGKVRYLSIILEEHLDCNLHNSLKHKLNTAKSEYLVKYDTTYQNFYWIHYTTQCFTLILYTPVKYGVKITPS